MPTHRLQACDERRLPESAGIESRDGRPAPKNRGLSEYVGN